MNPAQGSRPASTGPEALMPTLDAEGIETPPQSVTHADSEKSFSPPGPRVPTDHPAQTFEEILPGKMGQGSITTPTLSDLAIKAYQQEGGEKSSGATLSPTLADPEESGPAGSLSVQKHKTDQTSEQMAPGTNPTLSEVGLWEKTEAGASQANEKTAPPSPTVDLPGGSSPLGSNLETATLGSEYQNPFSPILSHGEGKKEGPGNPGETLDKETSPFQSAQQTGPSSQEMTATHAAGADLQNPNAATLDFPSGAVTNPVLGNTTAGVSGRGSNPRLEKTIFKDPIGGTSPSSQTLHLPPVGKKQAKAIPSPPGYEILGELGRGAMGVVYKARQMGLKRLVALKMILTATRTTPTKLARFQAEAEAVAKLDHPNIVRIYEIGNIDNLPFFSLEFVTGGTLGDRVKKTTPTARQAAIIIRGLAEAMDLSHRRGIVHRDLKPANILLAPPDQGGEITDLNTLPLDAFIPKVTDFGLVKTLEGDSLETKEGAIMGTPSYMAPEQAQGKVTQIGPPADIYGLGAILYDLVTGIPPFRGETVMDTISQVINREPVPPTRLNTGLPRDLGTICLKCLEKEPKKRYATAAALAEDLRRYLVGEPILARPTPWFEQAWKWAKRKPAVASLAATISLVLLATAVGGYVLARHEKNRADENFRLRQEAVKERNIAQEQRAFADRNFREALNTVNQLLTRVGTDRLAHEPRMEKVRRALLLDARTAMQRLLKDRSGDFQARRQTGLTLRHVGAIEALLGNHADADKYLDESIQILGALQLEDPKNEDILSDLADSHQTLAQSLFKQKKEAGSQKHFQDAFDLIARVGPNSSRDILMAAAVINMAQIKIGQGKAAEARAIQEEAVARLEKNLASAGDEGKYSLAQSFQVLGQTYDKLKLNAQAEAALQSALAVFQSLAKANPDNPDYRLDQCRVWNDIGLLLRDANPAEAEKNYRKSIVESQKLAKEFPSTPVYRQEVANSLNNLGILLESGGKSEEAQKVFEESSGISGQLAQEIQNVPDYRGKFAGSLASRALQLQNNGRFKEAAPLYQQALKDFRALTLQFPAAADFQTDFAATLLNEGILQISLGKPQAALTTITQARDEWGKILAQAQDIPEYRKHYCLALNALAELSMASGNAPEGERLFDQSIKDLTLLASQFPKEPDYLYLKAIALTTLGDYLKAAKQGDLASPRWKEGREAFQQLVSSYPQTPLYKQKLAEHLNKWATGLYQTAKVQEAAKAWEEAASLQQQLVNQHPTLENYRAELSKTLFNQGLSALGQNAINAANDLFLASLEVVRKGNQPASLTLLAPQSAPLAKLVEVSRASGKFPEAEKYFKELIALWRNLVQLDPMNTLASLELSGTMAGFAQFLSGRNRPAEGLPFALEAVQLTRAGGPAAADFRKQILLLACDIHSLAGKPADCLKLLEELAKAGPLRGEQYLEAAQIASKSVQGAEKMPGLSAAEKKKLVDGCAMVGNAFLEKALAAGAITVEQAKKDGSLEGLRR